MRIGATLLVWILLLVLLVIEVEVAKLPAGSVAAAFIGIGMAAVVAMTFMRLPSAPKTAAIFALAGLFWLCIMLGVGSMDSATRQDIGVAMRTEP